MTIDLPAVHASAASAFADRVGRIDPSQWEEATPCEGWNVRDLVNHVVSGNHWVGELAAGKTIDEVGDRFDGDVLGDDAFGAAGESARIATSAFNEPGAMDAMCAVSYGPVPGSVYCGHRIIDQVGHAWDLAVATGQDTDLPADHVAACIEIILPQFDLLAGSGAFGDASDPGESADPQHRLLSMLGRA